MRRLRRTAPGALAAITALALLAGCGTSEVKTTSVEATPTPAQQPQQQAPQGAPPQLSDEQRAAFDKLRSCLADQGVELPAGGPGAGGPPQIDPAAIQACSQYLPQGVAPGGAGPPGGTS
jgi:hypothetical protein